MRFADATEIPDSWSLVTLGDAAERILGGGTPSKAVKHYYEGDIPWVTVKDLNGMYITDARDHITEEAISKSASNLIPAGNVILATRMAVGSAHLNKVDVAINQDLKAIFPAEDVSAKYLTYWLRAHAQKLASLGAGSTVKGLGLSQIRRLPFPKPPVAEQDAIVNVVSSIDEALEASKAVLAQIKAAKEGVLQHLFAYGTGNSKASSHHLPHSWQLLNLNELGEGQVVRTGPFGSSLKTEHFAKTGVPVITIGSLGEGVIEKDALMFVPDAKADELETYKVQEGDLVFSRVADVGRSVRVGSDEAGWLMSSNLIRIRVDLSKVNSQFLMYAITRSSFVGQQIKRLTSGGGRGVVTSAVLSELMFAVPRFDEQNEMVSILGSFDEECSALAAKCRQLDLLRHALMRQLLTGKLRVAVDDG